MKIEKEMEPFGRSSLGVATTTYYPNYGINADDDVRGNLAISLARNTLREGFQLIIVDGGSNNKFIERLNEIDVNIVTQSEIGMDKSRFQVYQEISKLSNIKVIAWIEAEKAPLITDELWQISLSILRNKAKIIVPSRSRLGFESIPKYQEQSEKSANSILTTTLEKYKGERKIFLDLNEIPKIDWFLGPKIFGIELTAEFTNETPFWKGFQNFLGMKDPDLLKSYGYAGPLILPVIYALHKGIPVSSIEIKSYKHPAEQTKIETEHKKEYLKKRVKQLTDINLTVDLFCQYLSEHS